MKLKCLYAAIITICCSEAFSQQLTLGKTPYSMNKSAVLDLNADNQGLLLPRINDTALINILNPPDGMVIYFTPSKQVLIRSNGFWRSLATTANYITNLTGDVTAAGPGSVAATISNSAVTYAKIQNVTSNRLLGRATAGVGITEEISLGTGLSFTGTTLNVGSLPNSSLSNSSITVASGTTGSDFNISGSPVSLGGTVTLNFPNASASNRGLLTNTDWTTFNNKVSTTRTINTTAPLSGGGDLSADRTISMTQANSTTNGWLSSTDWNTFNSRVSSVGLSLPSIFTVTNSPVTGSGTLTGTLANQTQNLVFSSPNGSTGTPTFRSLVKADLPSTTVYTDQANTYTAGMKQTFRGNGTNAAVSFGGALTADPTTLTSGDLWFRSDVGKLRYFDGTTSRYLATETGSISGTTNYIAKYTPNGTTIGNSQIFDNGTNIGINTASPTNQVHIVGNATNPVRIEGLSTTTGNRFMVMDATGVVSLNTSVGISFLAKGTFNLDLPNIGNNSSIAFNFTVTGAQVGDNVLVSPSGELTNPDGTGLVTIGYAYVSAANQVTIRFVNATNVNVNVAAANYFVTVLR